MTWWLVRCTEPGCRFQRPAQYPDQTLALWVRNAHRRLTDHLVVIEYRDPANPGDLVAFNPDATGATAGGAP